MRNKYIENFEKIVLKNIPLFEELLNNIYGHNWDKTAIKKADLAMKSPKAQEAKRIGIQAFDVARVALGTAIKSAKDAMDKK